eukprot:UN00586
MSRLFIVFCSFLAFELVSSHLMFDSCDPGAQVIFEPCDPKTKEIKIHKCTTLPVLPIGVDFDPIPFFSTINIPQTIARLVKAVKVHSNFLQKWYGALQVFLNHDGVRRQVFGVAQPPWGLCSKADVDAAFFDAAAGVPFDAESCVGAAAASVLLGDHKPIDSFDVFIGDPVSGVWSLEINDEWALHLHMKPGEGFVEWTLTLTVDKCPELPVCCVNDCSVMPTGNYQSCSTCNGYVACSNGYKYDMPCASSRPGTPPLAWDDNKHSCQYTSATCPSNPALVPECHD